MFRAHDHVANIGSEDMYDSRERKESPTSADRIC